ncbi:MAG TPA: NAD(P)-binding domain-containing protein, partial [Longimicrobiales bacterium]
PNYFPTKGEMARYLENYAARFRLPVRTGVTVQRVSKAADGYLLETSAGRMEARNVVLAMANYQKPRLPPFARELDPAIVQLHSSEYRNPAQLREGGVLLVGAGNSGAEIAMEVSRSHPTWMSGRDVGHVPFRMDGLAARLILGRLVLRGVFHHVLTVRTPMGRKARLNANVHGGPLIRVKPRDLDAAGVRRVPRTEGVRDGKPLLADGRVLDVTNVIWCTGFQPGFSWIDLPVFGADGRPQHERGAALDAPGFYFVGLHYLYAMSSTMIHGVERDAQHVARLIAARGNVPQAAGRAPELSARTA